MATSTEILAAIADMTSDPTIWIAWSYDLNAAHPARREIVHRWAGLDLATRVDINGRIDAEYMVFDQPAASVLLIGPGEAWKYLGWLTQRCCHTSGGAGSIEEIIEGLRASGALFHPPSDLIVATEDMVGQINELPFYGRAKGVRSILPAILTIDPLPELPAFWCTDLARRSGDPWDAIDSAGQQFVDAVQQIDAALVDKKGPLGLIAFRDRDQQQQSHRPAREPLPPTHPEMARLNNWFRSIGLGA